MLKAGLIGLPSTGKSTLFRLLTSSGESATGSGRQKAQMGVARVPDTRLDRLTALFEPKKHVPATLEVTELTGHGGASALVDVSGFRDAHALLHLLRMFTDDRVPHASGSVDPLSDIRAMEDELILADLAVAERRLERIQQDRKKGKSRELDEEQRVIETCRSALEEGQALRNLSLEGDDTKRLRGFSFLSAKPQLIVLNLDEADVSDSAGAVERAGLSGALSGSGTEAVPLCAKIELEIAELPPEDRAAFLADLGLSDSGLDRVIRASYHLLGYRSFFTVGKDECRAWSIPAGTSAQEAAGEIHSDLARGFIRAEVVPCDALIARDGSHAACREHGEVRLEGKEYVVADGDVINFRFAT
ncbi:MAG: redox-regulated ATPase YchF [Acidobacteria bacterium]|nr:redox-regulated ATPase YchF [Acidobacteriota bacterium]|tara:strand:+ start:2543 stop:3622 length:1080 start_codon:yes stop_codon:yes gene_type:complete